MIHLENADFGILFQLIGLGLGFFRPVRYGAIAPDNYADLERWDLIRYGLAITLIALGSILQLSILK